VREHIAEARSDLEAETEPGIRTVLERLGDPSEIAAEGQERFGVQAAAPGTPWLEVIAVVCLVIPFVGWVVGIVLVWISRVWTTRDKVIATVLVPGGVMASFLLTLGSGPGGLGPLEVMVLAAPFFLGIPAAIYLGIRLRAYSNAVPATR
jgi:hypothetical protein